ncbi:putative toxin-antitoxin system toxin component, PIN family [Microcoleus sp. ARI1-B5]|uniref:putative toxin-antitoxin system toxin component, PIN family n=1 Tax=unclassified Microcoleus TaxID=2642155 RepID=UPI002FCEBA85
MLFQTSVPFRTIELAEKQGIILYCEATLKELEQVLNRQKFNKYLYLEERKLFLLKLISSSQSVYITERIAVCRDKKGNNF